MAGLKVGFALGSGSCSGFVLSSGLQVTSLGLGSGSGVGVRVLRAGVRGLGSWPCAPPPRALGAPGYCQGKG